MSTKNWTTVQNLTTDIQMTPKLFSIKDKLTRNWGSFYVKGEKEGKIYGYLKPTKDFDEVRHIFNAHEKAFSDPDGDTTASGKAILDLGAYLVDDSSGNSFEINKIIFINENLLVTCELSNPPA